MHIFVVKTIYCGNSKHVVMLQEFTQINVSERCDSLINKMIHTQ